MTHPTVLRRYRTLRQRTGSLRQVGELSAEVHMQRLDPWGLLSLAEEMDGGPERAAALLRAVIQDTERGD